MHENISQLVLIQLFHLEFRKFLGPMIIPVFSYVHSMGQHIFAVMNQHKF